MTSQERKEGRFVRRVAKRILNKMKRFNSLGTFNNIFSFINLYDAVNEVCKGIRWKGYVQDFEVHKLSRTAKNLQRLNDGWIPHKYKPFTICERGKTRNIEAPMIIDKQIHKVYTQQVLWKLYQSLLIPNNAASVKDKGLQYTQYRLKQDLQYHFRKYGMNGTIILIDFEKFFPSASHDKLIELHQATMFDDEVIYVANSIIKANGKEIGLPLGIEPSQVEMITLPHKLDAYIKCQLSIKGLGRYMDDYYLLIPPGINAKEILDKIKLKARQCEIKINESKIQVLPFGKPFRFCKTKYIITDTGKIITRCNPRSIKTARNKIRCFAKKYQNNEMTDIAVIQSLISSFGYMKKYNEHNQITQLQIIFKRMFELKWKRFVYISNFKNPKYKKDKDNLIEQKI